MSKKNSALATQKFYSIVETEGKKVFSLSAPFKSTILKDAGSIGEAVHNMRAAAAGKAELALNICSAFDAAKDGGFTSGLPEFVHNFIDASCPDKYGKNGDATRKIINSHAVFNGVELMVKNARAALKIQAERQKLIAEGKDPDSASEVREFNKEARDLKASQFTKAFTKCIVSFDKFGITETTISNFILLVLKKKNKENEELNADGIKLRDAAIKALFISRGMTVEEPKPPKPEDKPKVEASQFATSMEALKAARKGKR